MPTQLIVLDPEDTVAVVLSDMLSGETRDGLTARDDVPRGHKVARRAMAAGEPVIKYGQIMAVASKDIAMGEHVHVQNCSLPEGHSAQASVRGQLPEIPERNSFMGYLRPDGRVGHPQLYRCYGLGKLLQYRLRRHRGRGEPGAFAKISRYRRLCPYRS